MCCIFIVVIIVVLFGLGLFWFIWFKFILVVFKEVVEGKVEVMLVNICVGIVEVCQCIKLLIIVGGWIEFFGVKEGDKVKKG